LLLEIGKTLGLEGGRSAAGVVVGGNRGVGCGAAECDAGGRGGYRVQRGEGSEVDPLGAVVAVAAIVVGAAVVWADGGFGG